MTATEAALYDQVVNGNLRYWMGSLTHKNLPLAIFLEEADLGYPAWSGSTNSKVSNDQILSSLGIGIVRFNDELEPPEIDEFDYEYRVDTDVITSVRFPVASQIPTIPCLFNSSLRAELTRSVMFITRRATASLRG